MCIQKNIILELSKNYLNIKIKTKYYFKKLKYSINNFKFPFLHKK